MLMRAQMRARTDPGVVVVMKALLGLWRTEEVMLVTRTWLMIYRQQNINITSQLAMVTWQKIHFAPEQKYLTWLIMEMTKQDLDTNLSSPLLYVDGMHRRPPWTRWAKLLWHQREFFVLLFLPRSSLPTQFVDEEEDRRWQSHEYKNVYSKVLIWLQTVIQYKGSHRRVLFKMCKWHHLKTDSWRRSRRIRPMVDQPEGKGGRIFCQNEQKTYIKNLKVKRI